MPVDHPAVRVRHGRACPFPAHLSSPARTEIVTSLPPQRSAEDSRRLLAFSADQPATPSCWQAQPAAQTGAAGVKTGERRQGRVVGSRPDLRSERGMAVQIFAVSAVRSAVRKVLPDRVPGYRWQALEHSRTGFWYCWPAGGCR